MKTEQQSVQAHNHYFVILVYMLSSGDWKWTTSYMLLSMNENDEYFKHWICVEEVPWLIKYVRMCIHTHIHIHT